MEEAAIEENSGAASPMIVDRQEFAEDLKSGAPPRRSHSGSLSQSLSPSRERSPSSRRSRKNGRRNGKESFSRSRSRSPEKRRRRRSISPSRSASPRRRSRSYDRRSDRRRSPPRGTRDNPEPTEVLGLFGLSLRTKESDLDHLLSKFGNVEKITVVYDHRNNRSRGFGFATFERIEDATSARDALNGIDLQGRKIRVDYSLTQRPHDPTPGQYMGDKTRDRYRTGSSYRAPRRLSPRRSPYRRRSRSRSRSRDRRRTRRERTRSRTRSKSRSWSRSRR